MKTTLKRGVGRSADGNGRPVLPPATVSAITRYQQPQPSEPTGLALFRRILIGTLLVIGALSIGIAGGVYLYFHQSVASVRAHSSDVKIAQKALNVSLPGQPAIALALGYDQRAGSEYSTVSRSDTIMLIRADPATKTISLLSFPRDLIVPIYCKSGFVAHDRINSAYARCGATGSLETVKQLTGLPINYLITLNFHGFKEIVDDLGGVWMDIDRRYYNHNIGTAATDYSDINLQPGYQRLGGTKALEFVRFRHTDSDFYRLARQQSFVRALKQQIANNFSPLELPKLVSTITKNIEVGAASHFSDTTVLQDALLAATLPGGHFFQVRLDNVTGYSELDASASTIKQAIEEFSNPDVRSSKAANASALGEKLKTPKQKAPPVGDTTVTVLNGNGVAGSAANASYLLAQRGYVTVLPPANLQPNAPVQNYFHTVVYYDPKVSVAKAAAVALQKLLQPADVKALPDDPALHALDPGSMLLVIVGQTFHNELTAPTVPTVKIPARQAPSVFKDPTVGAELLAPYKKKVPFVLENPTVLASNSYPDHLGRDEPIRYYWITKEHKAIRMVFQIGGNQYWGIEETDWMDAPVLGDRSFRHSLNGREFEFFYTGTHLHMIALNANGATYWVVNTLLDSLSNETMIAIAKGLRPVPRGK